MARKSARKASRKSSRKTVRASRKRAAMKPSRPGGASTRRAGRPSGEDGRITSSQTRSRLGFTGPATSIVVPKNSVGAAVQAAVNFQNAGRVEVVREGPDSYRVSVTA